jgi:predicted dinucleotide-binding enzyme
VSDRIAVILGGTGMVGANMAQLLDRQGGRAAGRQGGRDVTVVSRRAPQFETRARHRFIP